MHYKPGKVTAPDLPSLHRNMSSSSNSWSIDKLRACTETVFHELVTNTVQEGKEDTTHNSSSELLDLLSNQSAEFEESFCVGNATTKSRFLTVLLAVTSTPHSQVCLPASDLLSIATANRSHADLVQNPAVAVIIEALADCASNSELPSSIRAGASSSMLSVAIPSAYFQEEKEGKCNVDGKNHNSHNEVPIDRLTRVYNLAVNSMITVVVERALLRKMSASLATEDMNDSLVASMADSTKEFTRILLQNSTQNYAILRRHLSRDCPEFVPGVVLPRLRAIVARAKSLQASSPTVTAATTDRNGQNGQPRAWLLIQRPLATVLCLMALLTFKVKAMRGLIAKADPLGSILAVPELCSHPHVLAVLIKLHVNIEGGFGPGWAADNKRALKCIRARLGELANATDLSNHSTSRKRKQALRVRAFYNAMHSHTVPFNRKSRAYPGCAFAWRVRDVVAPGETLGDFSGGGGRGYAGSSAGGGVLASTVVQSSEIIQVNSLNDSFFRNPRAATVNMGGGALSKAGAAAATAATASAATASAATVTAATASVSSGAGDVVDAKNVCRGEAVRSTAISGTMSSNEFATKRYAMNESSVAGERRVQMGGVQKYERRNEGKEANQQQHQAGSVLGRRVHDGVQKSERWNEGKCSDNLEMDEMDALLLGLDRGPPPARFLCGLTGAIMVDPLAHPRLEQVWVDRDALESWVDQALDNHKDVEGLVRWPGAPNGVEPFLPRELSQLRTDTSLQVDIQQWQVRKALTR